MVMKSLISNHLYLHLMVTAEQDAEAGLLLQSQVNTQHGSKIQDQS